MARDQVVPEEYTTRFRSVIVFGKIRILEDEREKFSAITTLAQKYAPDDTEENRNREIAKYRQTLCMMEMTIEHVTGKESKALAEQRSAQNGNERKAES